MILSFQSNYSKSPRMFFLLCASLLLSSPTVNGQSLRTEDWGGSSNNVGSGARERVLLGMQSQLCYSANDCAPGLSCVEQDTLHPLGPTGIVGSLMPRLSQFVREGLGFGGVLQGGICTRLRSDSEQETGEFNSEDGDLKDFKSMDVSGNGDLRNGNSKYGDLKTAQSTEAHDITCHQFETTLALDSQVTISVGGMDNQVFSVSGVGSPIVSVKEMRTGRLVPGAFSFACDVEGQFSLAFNVMVSSPSDVSSDTSRICRALIECRDSKSSGDLGEETTTTTVRPIIPRVQCFDFTADVTVDRGTTIPLANSVFRVDLTGGGDLSGSRLATKVKHIYPPGVPGESEGTILAFTCPREGPIPMSIAVTALEQTSNMFDLAICPFTINCVGVKRAVVECVAPAPHYFGMAGSVISVPLKSDQKNQNRKFFVSESSDGTELEATVIDMATQELLQELEVSCGTTPFTSIKQLEVTARLGDTEDSEICEIVIVCGGNVIDAPELE